MGTGWRRPWRPAVWWSRKGFPTGRPNGLWNQIFFWMNIPNGTWQPHISQSFYMKCFARRIMMAEGGRMYVPPRPPRPCKRTQFWRSICPVLYDTSWKELRDVYHSVYLLNRAPGFPSCGEVKRKRAIQEIFSLLQERLQRWPPSTDAKDASENKMDLAPLLTYEVALQDACCKVMDTTANLQSELDSSRTQCRTQSGSQHRRWSRGQSRMQSESRHRAGNLHQECSWGMSGDRAGAQSQDRQQVDSQNEWAHPQDCIWEPLNWRVSFRMPEGKDSATESREPSVKLSIKDLESRLDHQADQLGTPTWWGELKVIPGITDLCRFTWKIRVSFHVPEIRSRVSPNQGYSIPPAPKSLNWGAFLPERLEYQDVRQRPKLLTEAYCRCLQHWAEKVYPPTSPDAHPLAESVRELCLAVGEFVTITKWDILEGLEMDRPVDSCQPPPATIFSLVLGPPTEGQEKTPVAIGVPWQDGVPRPWGRASQFFSTRPSTHLPGAPTIPAFLPTRTLAVGQPSTLTWGFVDTPTNMKTLEPTHSDRRTPTDVPAVERMTSRISSISTSRIIWDDSTGSVYLDTVMTSIGRMVLGSTESSEGPTIEDVTDQL